MYGLPSLKMSIKLCTMKEVPAALLFRQRCRPSIVFISIVFLFIQESWLGEPSQFFGLQKRKGTDFCHSRFSGKVFEGFSLFVQKLKFVNVISNKHWLNKTKFFLFYLLSLSETALIYWCKMTSWMNFCFSVNYCLIRSLRCKDI